METNDEYLFECNSWLSRDYGDGEILREFAPSRDEGTLQGFHILSFHLLLLFGMYLFIYLFIYFRTFIQDKLHQF